MIKSPCIGVCTMIDKKCVGCLRTSAEISNWLSYSDVERDNITRRCIKNLDKAIKNTKKFREQ